MITASLFEYISKERIRNILVSLVLTLISVSEDFQDDFFSLPWTISRRVLLGNVSLVYRTAQETFYIPANDNVYFVLHKNVNTPILTVFCKSLFSQRTILNDTLFWNDVSNVLSSFTTRFDEAQCSHLQINWSRLSNALHHNLFAALKSKPRQQVLFISE